MPTSSLKKEVLRHVPEIPETDVSLYFNHTDKIAPNAETALIGIEKLYDYLDDNPGVAINIRESGMEAVLNRAGWDGNDLILHTHRRTDLYEEYVKMYLNHSVLFTDSKMSRLNSADCLWIRKRGNTEFRHALFIEDFTYEHHKHIFLYSGIKTDRNNSLTLRQFGILPSSFYTVRPEYEMYFPTPTIAGNPAIPNTDGFIRELRTSLDWNKLVYGVSSDKPPDPVYRT